MKKLCIYLMLFVLAFNFSVLPVFASQIETTEPTNSNQSETTLVEDIAGLDAPGAILGTEKLVNNVKAAVVYEANSGTMMYSWNADAPLYPASFVKLMTALLAIEKGNLADEVVVSETVKNSIPIDAVSIKLSVGEVVTLENLLYGLIVGSGNDAAVVIAEHISGSETKFVELMNERAREMGCIGTNFTNVHGLHDENQCITARDAAKMLDAALKNEVFYKMFSTVSFDIPATNKSAVRNLMTGNSLMDKTSRLYFDSRAIGGRTGVTNDGRRCLAAAAKSNGMFLITIVMGAESVYQDDGYSAISVGGYKETSDLLDLCDSKYKAAQILYPGQILRQMSVADGLNDLTIGPNETLMAVLPKDAVVSDLDFRYVDRILKAPISKGDLISQVQVWSDGMCIAQADMFAMNNVAVRNADVHEDEADATDGLAVVLSVITVAIVIAVIMYYAKRFNLIGRLRSKTRIKRRNRRRGRS